MQDLTVPIAQRGMGGINTAQLIEAEGLDVSTTEALTSDGQTVGQQVRASSLSPRTGFRWANVEFTPFSGSYKEDQQTTDNGTLISVSLQLFVPGADRLNRAQIKNLTGRPLVIRVEDNMGEQRLCGFGGQYMRLERAQYDTQVEAAGRRGTLLEFSGRFTDLPPVII